MTMTIADAMALLHDQLAELATYGVEPTRVPELRSGDGMLCYFDRTDGRIYLSLPDPNEPIGKLRSLLYRSMTACESDAELQAFVALLLPQLIAHELGHCLRHQFGRFGDDLWHEEQVATQFANALTKRRLAPAEATRLAWFLRRALAHLASQTGGETGAATAARNTYHDRWAALTASGALRTEVAGVLATLHRLLSVSPEAMLSEAGDQFASAISQLGERDRQIETFNQHYTAQVGRYMVHQFTWMLMDLESPEQRYLHEVVSDHFLAPEPRLPQAPVAPTSPEALRAYFHAAPEAAHRHPAAGRYFYKRYREMLLAVIEGHLADRSDTAHEEIRQILEPWAEAPSDLLSLTAPLLSDRYLKSLPQHLRDGPVMAADQIEAFLESATDRRLWRQVMGQVGDPAAATTLDRFTIVDATESLRRVPASLAHRLASAFIPLRLRAGEVLIWEGSDNLDLFVITEGLVEVVIDALGAPRQLATLGPGNVVGEAAFLARQPRTATVQALQPTTCVVLKATDLQRLAYQHPQLLMQLGGVLARRLALTVATMSRAGAAGATSDGV
ncbi:MAG: hypothetical protein RI891_866 [Gemmatimonadota bacterium]